MSYTIAPSPDGEYVLLTVVGEIDGESAMQQNVEAHSFGRSLGVNRYLVDLTDCRNTESVVGNYDFAHNRMKTDDIDISAVVAVLVSPGDHSHDFVETVARNAGLNVTLFTDRAAAERHLRGSA